MSPLYYCPGEFYPEDVRNAANGESHPLTSESDLKSPIGNYVRGDQLDYVVVQECFYHAFYNRAGVPNELKNATKNSQVWLNGGDYQINKPLIIDSTYGGNIIGSGIHITKLSKFNWTVEVILKLTNCHKLVFRGITFNGLVEIDSSCDEIGFEHCHFVHGIQIGTKLAFDGKTIHSLVLVP